MSLIRDADSAGPQTVIVTGAAGYIGSHVCQSLLRRGDSVVGLDAFTEHYDPARKRANIEAVQATASDTATGAFRLVTGDVRRASDLDAAFAAGLDLSAGQPVRRLIHLAARAGVRGPIEESRDYVSLNVTGTLEVLEACRRHGLGGEAVADEAGHLVLASSSTVYGNGPAGWDGPFAEDLAADRPVSVYGASKRSCELLAHAYSRLADLRVTCLRFFGVMGPRCRPDLSPYAFTDAAWHGRPIKRFGDGSSARDYTFIGDIVWGILAALDRFDLAAAGQVQPGERYECINLGNDHPITLNTYLQTLERLVAPHGKRLLVEPAPPHPMDAQRTWADLAKARRLLGYEPTTSFEQALEAAVSWYAREVAGR